MFLRTFPLLLEEKGRVSWDRMNIARAAPIRSSEKRAPVCCRIRRPSSIRRTQARASLRTAFRKWAKANPAATRVRISSPTSSDAPTRPPPACRRRRRVELWRTAAGAQGRSIGPPGAAAKTPKKKTPIFARRSRFMYRDCSRSMSGDVTLDIPNYLI